MPSTRQRNPRNNAGQVDEAKAATVAANIAEARKNRKNKKTKPKDSILKSWGLRSSTIQAVSVLVLAIIASVAWNAFTENVTADPALKEYLKSFCKEAFCSDALMPSRRTQKATRDIPRNQKIVKIPRHLQIWDLDAMRDPFIREQLFPARLMDKYPLDPEVFLAAHLSRLQTKPPKDLHPLIKKYLSLLPTYEDFAKHHPFMFSEEKLRESLGDYTLTYDLAQTYRHSISAEYAALSEVSEDYAAQITYQQYVLARLHVMTRSFGTGVVPPSEALEDQTMEEELEFYRRTAEVDMARGSHAMVPVLDFYDHHTNHNVAYSYDANKRAFVITSRGVPAGSELFDTYGLHSEGHLWAKYGFINGDGSNPTQASIALWHSVHDRYLEEDILERGAQLLPYLQYDDGYANCVDEEDPVAFELKTHKFLQLMHLSYHPPSWVFTVGPFDPTAAPQLASDMPPKREIPDPEPSELRFDANHIFGTCRLLSLTHRDYNGTALEYMKSNLYNSTFILPTTSDGLEFRTVMCVARLAKTALSRFGSGDSTSIVEAQKKELAKHPFQSEGWTMAHIRLGEMQNLRVLLGVALKALQHFHGENDGIYPLNSDEDHFMRDVPCEANSLAPLLRNLQQPTGEAVEE